MDGALLASLRRQIAELESQALRAQRLSYHLQNVVDMIVLGGEATTMDGLSILELRNMYQKHLNDNELDTIFASDSDTLAPTDLQWINFINKVRQATRKAMPTSTDEAQTLA